MGSDHRGVRLGSLSTLLMVAAIATGFALAAPTHAGKPSAADRETARSLMKKGDQYLRENDATQALRAYQAAHSIMNVPPTGTAVVRALTQLGRLVEARDVALQVIRSPVQAHEPAVWTRAREDASTAARDLESRIAGLIVNVEAAQVAIDGVLLADAAIGLVRKVDPGAHVVVVSAPGFKDTRVEVTLAEGETRELKLQLEPIAEPVPPPAPLPSSQPPPPSPPPRVTVAPPPPPAAAEPEPPAGAHLLLFGGASVAVLGLTVGSISGVMALNQTSDLTSACPSAGCPPNRQDDYDSAHRLATVSNIAFAVCALGIGAGAYGYYLSGSHTGDKTTGSSKPSIWPVAGLGAAGLQGSF